MYIFLLHCSSWSAAPSWLRWIFPGAQGPGSPIRGCFAGRSPSHASANSFLLLFCTSAPSGFSKKPSVYHKTPAGFFSYDSSLGGMAPFTRWTAAYLPKALPEGIFFLKPYRKCHFTNIFSGTKVWLKISLPFWVTHLCSSNFFFLINPVAVHPLW